MILHLKIHHDIIIKRGKVNIWIGKIRTSIQKQIKKNKNNQQFMYQTRQRLLLKFRLMSRKSWKQWLGSTESTLLWGLNFSIQRVSEVHGSNTREICCHPFIRQSSHTNTKKVLSTFYHIPVLSNFHNFRFVDRVGSF